MAEEDKRESEWEREGIGREKGREGESERKRAEEKMGEREWVRQ